MNAAFPPPESVPLDIVVKHGTLTWYEPDWTAGLERAARLVATFGVDTHGVPLVYARTPIGAVDPQPVDRRRPATASKALAA